MCKPHITKIPLSQDLHHLVPCWPGGQPGDQDCHFELQASKHSCSLKVPRNNSACAALATMLILRYEFCIYKYTTSCLTLLYLPYLPACLPSPAASCQLSDLSDNEVYKFHPNIVCKSRHDCVHVVYVVAQVPTSPASP